MLYLYINTMEGGFVQTNTDILGHFKGHINLHE